MADNDDPQVKACKTFVQSLKDDFNNFDITGWDAERVIGLLKSIVNDRENYAEDSSFTFKIRQTSETEISFQLVANPTPDQPGNGVITTDISANINGSLSHKKLCEKLKGHYKDDTRSFAKHIKDVFANNSKIFEVPEVTRSAYMILLFEIGRRLVSDDEKSSDRKKDLDKLPIASAIKKLVKLMEDEKCTFHDVFSKDGDFHCFSGEPSDRKNAIEKIDQHYEEMLPQEQDLAAKLRDKLKI